MAGAYAVGEGLATQVAVDESSCDPDLGESQVDGYILGAVLHEYGHTVSSLEAGRGAQHVGYFVGELVQLLEGQLTILEQYGHLVGVPCRSFLEAIGQVEVFLLDSYHLFDDFGKLSNIPA